MKNLRHVHGALSLETIEARPVFDGDQIRDLEVEEKNRAKEIIEDFMIAANGVTARYLAARRSPFDPPGGAHAQTLGPDRRDCRGARVQAARATRIQERWRSSWSSEKAADPLRFPDLSLAVIKLLGAGEYVAELPGGQCSGALRPGGQGLRPFHRPESPLPRSDHPAPAEGRPGRPTCALWQDELDVLAQHCTEEEDAANKVERQVAKSAAALLLESRIGEQFDAIVTGASEKGTWVRLLSVPVEGQAGAGVRGPRCRRPDSRAVESRRRSARIH